MRPRAPMRAGPSPMRARVVRAVLALGSVAVAASCASWFGGVAGSDVLREAADPALWDGAAEATSEDGGDPAPEGFEDEALALAGREDVRTDASARVVGFTTQGEAAAAFEEAAAELEGKGWTQVESGMPACGTFVKRDGTYRWLFVSGVQVGKGASMVVHYDGQLDGKG